MKKNIILIFTIWLGACSPVYSGYSCLSPLNIPAINSDFQLLWSRTGIAIYPDRFNSLMQGVRSKVFIVTSKDFEYGGSKILALDTQSGNVLWQRDAVLPASIITSNTQLYTTLNDKIDIVDPQTGNLVREIEIPNVGTIYNVFATEHNLYAFTKSGRHLIYNIDDGIYGLSEPFLAYYPIIIENGLMYFTEAGSYKAKEVQTQSILWEYSLNETVNVHPLFTDNVIVISTVMGRIYGLDKRTGNLLWNVDAHAISNVTASKSKLYLLAGDGHLKVLDINNGQEIAKLEFSPASFESNSPSTSNIIGAYNVWVDSENDILLVSFGDSCQLSSFKLHISQ